MAEQYLSKNTKKVARILNENVYSDEDCLLILRTILGKSKRVMLVEPLDYEDLIGAMKMCKIVLTDSGGIQEEAPSLGKPILVLRESTERQEGVEAGTAKIIGSNPKVIVEETINLLQNENEYKNRVIS